MNAACTWCGAEVEADDGFRAYEPVGERRAVFCRLEHLIPWSIQMMRGRSAGEAEERPVSGWEPGTISEPATVDEGVANCSHCGAELGDAHVLLVRHRGEHRIPDAFCGVDHMTEWAKAGGRWR
ncbi:MAG TPA: hypothetical protein VH329_04175 [Solirubrobacterales bacterium]|jgi:hypothetical protein